MTRKDLTASLIIGAAVGLLIQPILANTLTSVHLTLAVRVGIFVFFALFAPFALWLCSLIGKVWKAFYQFGQFAAVGTLNSFIDIGIFNLETFLYGRRRSSDARSLPSSKRSRSSAPPQTVFFGTGIGRSMRKIK